MLPDFNTSPPLPGTRLPAWHEIIAKALTRPSPDTFRGIGQSPLAARSRAARWVFLSALGGYIVTIILTLVRGGQWQWLYLAGVPLFPALALLVFWLITSLVSWLGGKLGEPAPYDQLALACAAFYVPYFIFAGFLFGSPFFLLLEVYWLVLHAVAVKGVHNLSWGRAILAGLPAFGVIPLLFIAAVAVLISALRQAG